MPADPTSFAGGSRLYHSALSARVKVAAASRIVKVWFVTSEGSDGETISPAAAGAVASS